MRRTTALSASTPNAELRVPDALDGLVSPLLRGLVAKGAYRIEVFSHARTGEPPYWLAFIFTVDGRRHAVGKPELRRSPLSDQVANLLHQLENWDPSSAPKLDNLN